MRRGRRRARRSARIAFLGGRPHHAVGLWPVALRDDLRRALTFEGLRQVAAWTARYGVATAVWPSMLRDPFFNVNTPADLAEAERLAADSHPASVRSLQHEPQREGDEPERGHARSIESDEPDEPAHQ